ncbi:hypothetical protein CYMTET_55230 [Cymbomonas tetramitiformis]|uniref:Uncharacterized protein n=1 Tax=Cymbomonas tetramitiformis TaxID=36881 RepID=A0AAE0BF09_9CHLO|nr:hypothetical protein CYMTET_55230 [Cymbomonas tetramitiformis]|eukprot:gene70-100_t
MSICAICRTPRNAAYTRGPDRYMRRVYEDVREHTCPLCTDETKYSLSGLVQHLRERCASVQVTMSRDDVVRMKAKWLQESATSLTLDDTVLSALQSELVSQTRDQLLPLLVAGEARVKELQQEHVKALEQQAAKFNEEMTRMKERHKTSMSSTLKHANELEESIANMRHRCYESQEKLRVERMSKKRKVAEVAEKVAR